MLNGADISYNYLRFIYCYRDKFYGSSINTYCYLSRCVVRDISYCT